MVQVKLVCVFEGEVLDMVVDICFGLVIYGKWFSFWLSVENKRQFFVFCGFVYGYFVFSFMVEFFYKCDNFYFKVYEGGIFFNDVELGIDWEFDFNEVILFEKDKVQFEFGEYCLVWQICIS